MMLDFKITCLLHGSVCVCVSQNTDGGSELKRQDAHVAPLNHRIKTANPAPVL